MWERRHVRRVALVINPASRSAADHAENLRQILRLQVEVVDIGADSPEECVAQVTEARQDVDLVIAAGGDGTLHYAARALVGFDTPLGVIPLGTANDFARSVGLPLELERAVDVALHGVTTPVDVGRVDGVPYLNVAGVGVIGTITDEMSPATKRVLGPIAYVEAAARVCLDAEPFEVALEIDGARETRSVLQVLVGNGRYFGPALEVSPGANPDDGLLDLCLIEAETTFEKAAAALHLFLGSHARSDGLDVRQLARVRIETEHARRVVADGELVSETPVVVDVARGALPVQLPLRR